MFVAVKNDDRFLIGCSVRDRNINVDESDLLLEDNIPVWKVRGKKGVLVACGECGFAATLLKYNDRLFNFEINDDEMFGDFVRRLKHFLYHFDVINDKGHWENELLLVKDDFAYVVASDFTVLKIVDYKSSNEMNRLTRGSLVHSEGEPAKKRIVDAFKLVGKMQNKELFPIAIYDSKTGKRKIVRKIESIRL